MGIRLLAIGLIAGLMAACTSSHADPKPSSTPTSSVTSKSSVSPSATPSRTGPLTTGPNVRPGEKPPVYPELAKQHTANGALAFAGYYFKALDWSIATNDDALVRSIAASNCGACSKAYSAIANLRRKHERELGGRITILEAAIDDVKYQLKYDFAVRVTYGEQAVRLVSETGATRTTSPAVRRAVSLVFARWQKNGWRVVDVTAT